MRWQWSEEEDEAIHALQNNAAQILYLRGFRKHMDFATGIVGIKRRISYQQFIELIEERREVGSHRPVSVPSPNTIRWLITRMERVGLIERIPSAGPMVFRLPLATKDIISQPAQQSTAATKQKEKNTEQSVCVDTINSQAEQQLQQTNKYLPCPHQQILKIWNEVMPGHITRPRETFWKPDRKAHKDLTARWKQCFDIIHSQKGLPLYADLESGLQWWRGFFVHCTKSDFLMDRCRAFELGWVVNRENFIKIQEGKYHERV